MTQRKPLRTRSINTITEAFLGHMNLTDLSKSTTSLEIRRWSIYAMNCELRLSESMHLGCLTSSSSSSVAQLSI